MSQLLDDLRTARAIAEGRDNLIAARTFFRELYNDDLRAKKFDAALCLAIAHHAGDADAVETAARMIDPEIFLKIFDLAIAAEASCL